MKFSALLIAFSVILTIFAVLGEEKAQNSSPGKSNDLKEVILLVRDIEPFATIQGETEGWWRNGTPQGKAARRQNLILKDGTKLWILYCSFDSPEQAIKAAALHRADVEEVFQDGCWNGPEKVGDSCWTGTNKQTSGLMFQKGRYCVLISALDKNRAQQTLVLELARKTEKKIAAIIFKENNPDMQNGGKNNKSNIDNPDAANAGGITENKTAAVGPDATNTSESIDSNANGRGKVNATEKSNSGDGKTVAGKIDVPKKAADGVKSYTPVLIAAAAIFLFLLGFIVIRVRKRA